MIKLIKVIKNEKYTDSTGKERYAVQRYIEFDGGAKILVKPVFKDGFTLFDAFAQVENHVRKE